MMLAAYIKIINNFLNRNKFILTNKHRRVEKNSVNLHWWKVDGKLQNVGDMLSVVVFEYMIKYYKINSEKNVKQSTYTR